MLNLTHHYKILYAYLRFCSNYLLAFQEWWLRFVSVSGSTRMKSFLNCANIIALSQNYFLANKIFKTWENDILDHVIIK